MVRSSAITVYLERAEKRTFACVVDWPGWCRSGRDDASALAALLAAGPRYARALTGTRLGFVAPKDVGSLEVVERLRGDATTDFGAPSQTPTVDARPMDEADLRRARAILRACWRAFDGVRWKPRHIVRRSGWHWLDHAWEIEDRVS